LNQFVGYLYLERAFRASREECALDTLVQTLEAAVYDLLANRSRHVTRPRSV
jgi:hypothetical protein